MIDIIKTGKGSIRIRAKHNIETIIFNYYYWNSFC
jgi:hypothetical protein